jgi:dethiobiotin synthetase
MSNAIFITGTDTGVGKTYVTALILAELRRRGVKAAAFKPIACGRGGRHDAEIYRKLMKHEQPLDVINPIYLQHALAPSVAARLEHRRIDLKIVFASYRLLVKQYDVVLVEGAGGLLVPIKQNYFVADLARELKLPVLIVARLGLGTINHTLLTVRQTKNVAGIVLNDAAGKRGLAERTNIVEIPRLTGVPLLGVVSRGAKRIDLSGFRDAGVFE